jgi:hygromycin-B 7''-O-kinase
MPRLRLPNAADPARFDLRLHDPAWREAAATVCARHRVPHEDLRRSPQGENVIYFAGRSHVIKIYGPARAQYGRERASLRFAAGLRLGVATPEVLHEGEIEGWPYLVMTRLAGVLMRDVWREVAPEERIEIVSQIGAAMRELHAHEPPSDEPALARDWDAFVGRQVSESVGRQRALGASPEWLASLPAFFASRLPLLPLEFAPVLLHGDIHPGNLLLARDRAGAWRASGLFDFGDSFAGAREYEFVAPGVLMVQGDRALQRTLLRSYGYADSQMDETLRARLMLLTVLYECSDLRKYALRLAPDAVNLTLARLERAVWAFADA